MTTIVVDASVAIKWLLPTRSGEDHTAQALSVLNDVRERRIDLVQPPHWLAEVGEVMARLAPKISLDGIRLLEAMEIATVSGCSVYETGLSLAMSLEHHLFDTLYHAVPLTGNADYLLTADTRYFRKAAKHGAIRELANY